MQNSSWDFCILWSLIFHRINVSAGTQACWQLVWVLYSFYWLVFPIPELWMQKMFVSISLLIPSTIWYLQRKNAQLARFWSEFVAPFGLILWNSFPIFAYWFCLIVGLLGLSIVAFVIGVLLGLTITADGWSASIHFISFAFCESVPASYLPILLMDPFILSLLQNNCIGEKNTRYFMAFLLWWVINQQDVIRHFRI